MNLISEGTHRRLPEGNSSRQGDNMPRPRQWGACALGPGLLRLFYAGAVVVTPLLTISLAYGQTTTPSTAAVPTDQLQEVVVTANRRSERQQDVPISVTALSAETLASSGVSSLVDLRAVATGLNIQQDNGFMTTHLRGVGSSIIGPGLENPIALYVDGVYYASSASSLIDFVNVADVQVLKGPQGTLFGRNATGGLIQITTKTPTQEFHLDADAGYGNYETGKADFYVTGGILQNLASDLAVQVKHQGDGYGTNFATGKDVYRDDFDGTVRSKSLYAPSDATTLTAIFDFSHTRNSDNVLSLNPGTLASPASASYLFSHPWDTSMNVQPLIENKSGGASVHLDQDLGFAHLSDIVAYRRSTTDLDFDLDATAVPEEAAFLVENEHQLSEEIQLQSQTSSRVKWSAGIYYFNAVGAYVPPSLVTLGTTEGIALQGEEKTQSVAGYGQATTEILPQTNLTVGLRYTYENRKLIAGQSLLADGIPVASLGTADTSKSFDRPTYRVALDHRFSDETLAYVSFNTGFKSGGFNTQVPTDPAFSPETLKAYELGLKNDLLDRKVRLNVATFYYDYNNIQEQRLELASSGVINGPPAHIYGVDLDLQARITSALRLNAGLEYLHDRFVGSAPPLPIGTTEGGVPLASGSVAGNRLPVTPDTVATFGADYFFTAFRGEADANATYEYNSGWYAEPDNIIHQRAFNKLNLSLRWTSSDNHYTVALWCNNVTNAAVFGSGTTQVSGVQEVQFEPPRTFGITLGYHL